MVCVRPHSAVCFVCRFVAGWSLCGVCVEGQATFSGFCE